MCEFFAKRVAAWIAFKHQKKKNTMLYGDYLTFETSGMSLILCHVCLIFGMIQVYLFLCI